MTVLKQYYIYRVQQTYRIVHSTGSKQLYEKRLSEFESMIQSRTWSPNGKENGGSGGNLIQEKQIIESINNRLHKKFPKLLNTINSMARWKLKQAKDTITKQEIANATAELISTIP